MIIIITPPANRPVGPPLVLAPAEVDKALVSAGSLCVEEGEIMASGGAPSSFIG